MEDNQRYRLIADINLAFTPGAPVDSRDLFAGRTRQVQKVINTIFRRGQHAILFGERGVGKTSLANTLYDFLVLSGRSNFQRARHNCAEGMDFEAIWRSIFRQLTVNRDSGILTAEDMLPPNPNPENIREVFQGLDNPSIIIIDELDRIVDAGIQRDLADTIKTLSDNSINTTLIMVGVADSIDQLIDEHQSIERALVQVPMQRMSKLELLEIVDKGLEKCGVSVTDEAKARIADFSQGLPSYTHLLAREAALCAVNHDRTNITMEDLKEAIQESVESQLETNLSSYNTAVTSPRGTYFKPVLLACALAMKDELGFFYAKNVTQPLALITNAEAKVPAFAKHLKIFCDESRGPVLERRGVANKMRYRFIRPIMGPYVILKGLSDGLIQESQLSRPSVDSSQHEQLSMQFPASGIETGAFS